MQRLDHLAASARAQSGLLTNAQLEAAGMQPGAVKYRTRVGGLERVAPGVRRVGGTPITWRQRLEAACLATGPLSAASHRSALALWGLITWEDVPVEITVVYERDPDGCDAVVHRSKDLLPQDIELVDGIPCTSVVRTLVDAGAVLQDRTVERLLERALVRQLTTVAEVRDFMERVAARGRRGVGVMRRVLEARAYGESASQSEAEELLARICREHGLPPAVPQYRVEVEGGLRFLDFAYPQPLLLAIEVDGFGPHTQRHVFEDDRVRRDELTLLGWMLLHVTWRQMTKRAWWVARTIGRAIDLRTSAAPLPPSVL